MTFGQFNFYSYLCKKKMKMEKERFDKFIKENHKLILKIGESAATLHDLKCNQKYGDKLPYSYHLGMVANLALEHGHLVCSEEAHVIPIIFGAYFHDSIEDARVTYNDVMKIAKTFMGSDQALIATEIVYALTDEKGRSRAERGSDKHYEDIRGTLYAPFVKCCDRLANYTYGKKMGSRMADVYKKEMPSFLEKIGKEKYIGEEFYEIMRSA
jgi:hypothetical protein